MAICPSRSNAGYVCTFFLENRLSDSFRACIGMLIDEAMDYLNVDLELVLKSDG